MSNSGQVAGSEINTENRINKSYSKNENISYPIYNFLRHQFDFFSENCPILNKCFKIKCKEMDFNSCSCEKGICALGTQCKVSALVFNSIMGEPKKDVSPKSFQTMETIIENMEDNTFINFCIAVNSVEPDFVGHRFNIICLKEKGKYIFFRLQSYVNCYPFSYEELSYKDLKEQMTSFINIFEDDKKSEIFTNQQYKIWKKFTGEKLSIGNNKPINNISYFKYYEIMITNKNQWENIIISNIRNLIKETKDESRYIKKMLKLLNDTFRGKFSINDSDFQDILDSIRETQENLRMKINNESKEINVSFQNQGEVNMLQYKKNEIFTPQFLENQPNFIKKVRFNIPEKNRTPFDLKITSNNIESRNNSNLKITSNNIELGSAQTPQIVRTN